MLTAFYGKTPEVSQKAVAAVRDGEVLGVAGIYRYKTRSILFSTIRPDVLENMDRFDYRKAFVKCMYKTLEYARQSRLPVISIANPDIPGACKLLERVGLTKINEGVYEWTP